MKTLNFSLFICTLALFFNSVFAQTTAPAIPDSSFKAYKLIKEKKWREANAVAKNATVAQPNDAEAWFVLGLTEERLENLEDAIKAYEKYLELIPAPAAAEIVVARIAELKPRASHQQQDKYGASSNGFFIEKQLSYKPNFITEINGEMNTPFSFGFSFGMVNVGYRRASGTFKENIKEPASHQASPAYTTITGGGAITHQDLFANIYFSLIDPYTSMGDMQLAMPFTAGLVSNTLEATGNGKRYGNVTYDFGLGLALRGFTRSPLSWYAQGIYHVGIPFWGIRESGYDKGIKNAQGDDIKGNIHNFEISAGITFLFGEDLLKHY
ncbi:MAG: tetratricopeptide repeat protein [Pseudomonadota bacterium]|nr:tetratricopeptide repeat protein [Pseudomonadota bacterium]